MFRQTLVLFVSQLLFVAFSVATLNDIWLSVPDKTAPLSSTIVARFLIKYFGDQKVKQICVVSHVNSDRRISYDSNISHLLQSIRGEFSYRFSNNLQWPMESIGKSVVVFLVADYMEWQ